MKRFLHAWYQHADRRELRVRRIEKPASGKRPRNADAVTDAPLRDLS